MIGDTNLVVRPIPAPGRWSEVDSRVGELRFRHVARDGVGTPLLCVHGIGPGSTGLANFAPLLSALPDQTPVHLIDLLGFGGSDRKPTQPGFDAGLWLDQIAAALDTIDRPALLVGNSVGGALALKTAAGRRDLAAVLAIGAPAACFEPPAALQAFWRAPKDASALAAAMQPMTGDQRTPSPQLVAERWAAFADPTYAAWFDEALADPAACLAQVALSDEEAGRIDAPAHLLHGALDRACPPGGVVDLVLRGAIRADLTLLAGCGHNILAERTGEVLAEIAKLMTTTRNKA